MADDTKEQSKEKNDLNFGNILLFENRMVGPCASDIGCARPLCRNSTNYLFE